MDDVMATRTMIMVASLLLATWAAWGLPRPLLAQFPDRPLEAALAGLGAGCLIAVTGGILALCPGQPPTTQVLLATVLVVIGASIWFGVWIRG